MTKDTWEGKGLCFKLVFLHGSSSSNEGKTITQAVQGPGARSENRSHARVLFTGLFLMACSACYLVETRTTSPGIVPPIMGWALPHQSRRKWLTIGSYGGISSIQVPSSLCQADIKQARTPSFSPFIFSLCKHVEVGRQLWKSFDHVGSGITLGIRITRQGPLFINSSH